MTQGPIELSGRTVELRTLAAALRDVERSRTALVLEVVGEAGIGKTALLGTLASTTGDRLVLEGRAAQYERDLPFGVFIDALDEHLAGLGPGRLDAARLSELAAVFPAVEPLVAQPPKVLDSERFRLYRAVRWLLERLAGDRSLVLVLDDLHWADPASCELIASLLRRPPAAAVLVALAYRTGRAPVQLAGELASAAADARLRHVDLGPLSRAQAARLIDPVAAGCVERDWLYAQSGGNPFYLEQLLRSARRPALGGADGLVGRSAGEALAGEVPPAVASTLAGEVAALSGIAQAVIQAAAVAGELFEPDVVARIVGLAESDALAALDELLERDLVRETAVARRFRFRHPLVRHAVYGSVKGGWRLHAHARAAAVLAARGAGAVVCAPHVEQSASVGDDAAITLLAAAGAATAGRAPASSARWWEAALRLVPEQGPGSERALELLPRVAAALASAGRVDDAHSALVRAIELAGAREGGSPLELVAACAGVENLLGRSSDARRRLLGARARAGAGTREAALLELELATHGVYGANLDLLRDAAQRAQDCAVASGDAGLLGAALAMQSVAHNFSGEPAPAASACRRATDLLATLDDDALSERMGSLFFLAWSEWELGLIAECAVRLRRAIALARSSGRADWLPQLMVSRTIASVWMGRLDEALAISQECVEAAEVVGSPYMHMQSQWTRCMALAAVGELEQAVRAGERSVAIARGLSVSHYTAGAGWTCACALLDAGEPQKGIDVMLEMLGGPELPTVFLGWRTYCYESLTRAELALGRRGRARAWAARAASCAEQSGLAFAHVHADLAGAESLLASGDAAGAATLADRSALHADAIGARIDAARARLLAGRALAALGDRPSAADQLRTAETEFAACGARRRREEAVRELRRIGLRVRRPGQRAAADAAATGLRSLTGREREIAVLVRDRKTNREIAGDLFLSEKTIESHMRNIFVKLGVDARADVARQLEHVEAAASPASP